MRVSDAGRVSVGSVELAYETIGDRDHPPVILVMGLGGQLHYWPDGFCAELSGRRLQVVRFDNRDVGLSTHLTGADPAGAATSSGALTTVYTLSDLAADVVGLIAALGHQSAHLAGISLGGMIVQQAAIEHPDRVRSLVSIASTTGNPAVGAARPEALAALFTPPRAATREAIRDHALELARVIGSPGFELDEEWLAERAARAFDRCYDPAGVMRQAAAVAAATDRTGRLRGLRVPALVVHGTDDPLVALSGGVATAEAIPGAELLTIDGMGHDLPRGTWQAIADAIERTVRRGEADPG
jgi:pimeloyl-ACP methyl ester carboxylesterase